MAVGTSLTLALLAVLTASILHMTLFVLAGITLAPLRFSVWSGLGALAGAAVGMRVRHFVPQGHASKIVLGLFLLVGLGVLSQVL